MNKPAFIATVSIAVMPLFPACDSHNWEDDPEKGPGTKHLFESHGSSETNELEGEKARQQP
ncbi:MAG: hypothetical protein VCA55_13030 [Verrucomicrobiales bacterium]|jgi:hypothetical protein